MDPRDRLRELLGGAGCAACGGRVPAGGIRVLAQRDDLAFVELSCGACGSVALAIVLEADDDARGALAVDGTAHLELRPDEEARLRDSPPIAEADVAAMRDFLAGWRGDLRSLVGGADPGSGRRSGTSS